MAATVIFSSIWRAFFFLFTSSSSSLGFCSIISAMNIKTFTAALSFSVSFMATIVRDCGAKAIWCNFLTVFVVPAFILELISLLLSLKNRNQIVLHFLCSVLSGLNGVLIVNRWDVKSLRKIQDLKLLSALTAMILTARLASAWIHESKVLFLRVLAQFLTPNWPNCLLHLSFNHFLFKNTYSIENLRKFLIIII